MRSKLPIVAASLGLTLGFALSGCSADNALVLADAAHDAQAAADAKALLVAHAEALRDHTAAICAAAPAPMADGWDPKRDAASLGAMKKAWKEAHLAYASLEGAAGMLFPELAEQIDMRYEAALAAGSDPDPFDAVGFVGLHAIERVLWADRIPKAVVEVESGIEGYAAAAFPGDEAEADRFRERLCAHAVTEASELVEALEEASLDSSVLYEAAILLIEGQAEKVMDAGEGREESRYAAHSLADMSAAVASARATHEVFAAWLLSKEEGKEVGEGVSDGFARLEKEYAAFGSEALPYVPEGWSASALTHDLWETPFGQLFTVVTFESNDRLNGSLALAMEEVVEELGIAAAE